MKRLFAMFSLVAALTVLPTHEAHASCSDTAFDNAGSGFFYTYEAQYYGSSLNGTLRICHNPGDSDRYMYRVNQNAWFWLIRSADVSPGNPGVCGQNYGSAHTYQVWHNWGSDWTFDGGTFQCFCHGSTVTKNDCYWDM